MPSTTRLIPLNWDTLLTTPHFTIRFWDNDDRSAFPFGSARHVKTPSLQMQLHYVINVQRDCISEGLLDRKIFLQVGISERMFNGIRDY